MEEKKKVKGGRGYGTGEECRRGEVVEGVEVGGRSPWSWESKKRMWVKLEIVVKCDRKVLSAGQA